MSDPRPVVSDFTEDLYERLPEVYRSADAAQDVGESNYPLLRYLSLIGDQLASVIRYLDRFTYDPLDDRTNTDPPWSRYGSGRFGSGTYGDRDTADLVDPDRADASWLPWLCRLLGINPDGLDVEDMRAALREPEEAWAHGSPAAIARAVRRRIPDETYVDLRPRYLGNPFTIALVTESANGFSTWAELMELAPTWAELEAMGPWNNLESAPVMIAADVERPAGFQMVHVYLDDWTDTPPTPVPSTNLLGEDGSFEDRATALAKWTPDEFWGLFPVAPLVDTVIGDATDGVACLELTWQSTSGAVSYLVTGLVPGNTYRLDADVKVPTGSASVSVALGGTYISDLPTVSNDVWETLTVGPVIVNSTQADVMFFTWGQSMPGGKARIDNVRLTLL